jgi:hypothetical protein
VNVLEELVKCSKRCHSCTLESLSDKIGIWEALLDIPRHTK